MSTKTEPLFATVEETTRTLEALRNVDQTGMFGCALEMPAQILKAVEISDDFDEGDIPLDRSFGHLIGLGGSAVAGELLRDMISPRRSIQIHRGTRPLRDKRGVVVSSYSGNTGEILELAPLVIGGLKSAVFITSGGKLEQLAGELSIPVWKMPSGYQPRGAVGWSLGLLSSILERWRVFHDAQRQLAKAAQRLKDSLEQIGTENHIVIRAALPIAKALFGRHAIIFHSLKCQGAARRFAAQIAENSKQLAFPTMIPEAMHNVVEGIAGSDPAKWTLIFMSDVNDPSSLRSAIAPFIEHFSQMGFVCLPFPAAGDDQFELTLSRIMLGDFVSLFLAAKRGIDPTPIKTILALKQSLSGVT